MKNKKGFTFIELMTAAVILSIAVAGVYAAFTSATKFIGFFRHDIMGVILADSLLQQVRAAYEYGEPNPEVPSSAPSAVDVANGTTPDFSSTTLDDRLNSEVDSLSADPYAVNTVNLNGASNPEYSFKRVDIAIKWNERNI